MARPRHESPTPAELEVLQVIWDRGPSTVRDVMRVLNRQRPRAYTSVMSLMNVMVEKGLLTTQPKGRAFLYSARVSQGGTQGEIVKDLLNRVFDGSASALMMHLLAEAKPDSEELDEIRKTISEFAQEGRYVMSLVELFSQPVWHRLGLTLVHFLWQGLAVAVLVCAAVRVLRLQRGNRRYAAYLVAFAVMTVSPLLTFMILGVPAQPVSTPPGSTAPGLLVKMELPAPAAASLSPEPASPRHENVLSVSPTRPVHLRQKLDSALQVSLPWALVGWIGGVLILSVRLLLGFLGVYRWRRRAEPLAEDLQTRISRLSERLGLPGFRRVFTSRQAREVVALGYLARWCCCLSPS